MKRPWSANMAFSRIAARLCAEAKDAQILLSGRIATPVKGTIALEELGSMALKGITQPVSVFNVLDRYNGISVESRSEKKPTVRSRRSHCTASPVVGHGAKVLAFASVAEDPLYLGCKRFQREGLCHDLRTLFD
jgi:hypothetical protein